MKKTAKYFLIGCICFLSKTMLGATHGFFIKTDLIYEQNLLDVYQVRINQLISENGTLSEEDLAVLSNVAYQCDNNGGEAVQSARAILEWYDAEKYAYDRNTYCKEDVIFSKQQQQFNEIRIYPNPTSDLLTIDKGLLSCNSIAIYSINGLLIQKIELKEQRTSFNTSSLQNGVYYCRFLGNEDNIAPIKFSIIH